MAAFLGNLRNVVIASFVLAILLIGVYCATQGFDGPAFELFTLRWLHIACGVMWIGLLWYFNFVQIPTMPKVPAELKGGVTGYIAPAALFWFRWGAMGTIFFGIVLALRNHYLLEAYTLDLSEGAAGWPMVPKYLAIGIGMWLGTIMWFNVWFVIWPNQQKALNIGGKYPNLPADGEGRRRQDRDDLQPHQHAAVDPHAVQHGGGGPSVLSSRSNRLKQKAVRDRCGRPFSFGFDGRRSQPTALPHRCAPPIPTAISPPCSRRRRMRPFLFALYAFNAEVARVAETVREPMLGAIRLEWWRETAEGAAKGAPRNHDVARGLAALFAERGVALADLEALIAARAFDSSADHFADFAALEAYVDATSGAVMRLAAAILGGDPGCWSRAKRGWPMAWPDCCGRCRSTTAATSSICRWICCRRCM